MLISYKYCNVWCRLYRERFTQVDSKLLEIRSGRAQEYLQPLQQLQENMRIRTEVAAILKQFSLTSVNNQIDAEAIAAVQNLQVPLLNFNYTLFSFFYLKKILYIFFFF